MRNDYDSINYTGVQGASLSIMARDLYNAENWYATICPSYHWDHQYVHDIIPATLQTLFYNKSLLSLEDNGTKVGYVLHFTTPADESNANSPLLIFFGLQSSGERRYQYHVILAGEHNNIPVLTWSSALPLINCPHHYVKLLLEAAIRVSLLATGLFCAFQTLWMELY